MVGHCLGHSDDEIVDFKIVSVIRGNNNGVTTLDFRRTNFKPFRELFSRVPWESAFECWSVFKKHFVEAQEQAIPLCSKSSKQSRRPAWLKRELCGAQEKKEIV